MAISFIRTIILYVLIIFCIRFTGKRQISELQTSELVVMLLISNIASIPMQNIGLPLSTGIVPIILLVCLEIFTSSLMLGSSKFRKIICGNPIIVINDGKIMQSEMKKMRMTTEDLFEQLRQLDIFSINDVQFAIVETNGKLSVLKKPSKLQPDISDLNLKAEDKGIEVVIISDGELAYRSLELYNLDDKWLDSILKSEKVDIKDVFLMTVNKKCKYNIIRKVENN